MSENKHKTELRTRTIKESYCTSRKCKFFGKPAQQGICFSSESMATDWNKIDRLEKEHREETQQIRKRMESTDEYIRWLEAMYESSMINWSMTLDDLIRLRRENALLRTARASKRKRGK